MMTCFYQASSIWQIVLLVISQFAVIFLAAGFILLFKRKCKLPKMIGMGVMLLLTVPALVSKKLGRWQGFLLLCIYAAFCVFQFAL